MGTKIKSKLKPFNRTPPVCSSSFSLLIHNSTIQSHWSQKYTANKGKKTKSHIGKKPIPEKCTLCLPQPFLEACERRDARLVLEGWKPQVSGGQSGFSPSLKLSSYTLGFPKTQPYQTRTSFTLFSEIQTEGKGREGTEIQTTALNIYMIHLSVNVLMCVRFSLSTRMYSFANIYSVFLVRV